MSTSSYRLGERQSSTEETSTFQGAVLAALAMEYFFFLCFASFYSVNFDGICFEKCVEGGLFLLVNNIPGKHYQFLPFVV